MTDTLMALWDPSKESNNFGSLLMFVAELEATTDNYSNVDVACIVENTDPAFFALVASFFSKINNIFIFSDRGEYNRYSIKDQLSDRWSDVIDDVKISSSSYYGSTLFLQEYYNLNGNANKLFVPIGIKKKRDLWVSKYSDNSNIVVVHLKNSSTDEFSNASQEDWHKFFIYVLSKCYDIRFLLIGNDEVDRSISTLSNVVVTKEYGADVQIEISLILSAFMFMGMSSGPCNAAIFSNTPYLIWKHPDHHVEEMKVELKDSNYFPFARDNQLFLREYDTYSSLVNNFEKMYHDLGVSKG